MDRVLTIILGGGKGSRLYPLTRERCKPACPFGGKYRLVDIPISNSINSGFRRIYVLTQFNSASLNLHIGRTYNFDAFSQDYCEILAAQQGLHNEDGWYVGTADAVRKNMEHFRVEKPDYYIILSGDQLYRIDLREFMDEHIARGLPVSVACTPVKHSDTSGLGILKLSDSGRVENFIEKPESSRNIDEYKMPSSLRVPNEDGAQNKDYSASMGIYIFSADAMEETLKSDSTDFGKEIIPQAIEKGMVGAYLYHGYWEDIGTIGSFFETNIDLGSTEPRYNLYDQSSPLYTHRRDLPPTKINFSTIRNSLASEGSIITNSEVENSLLGVRTVIESGATLKEVYVMGTDFYETDEQKALNRKKSVPNYGIGENSRIHRAIIDRNARIGRDCEIGWNNLEDGDYGSYSVKDGVVVVLKGTVIPDGTVI